MPGRYFIKTFGCQMNEYDSARMADVLEAGAGLTATTEPAEADVLLMNTCSVREKAQEKVFSLLGEWRALKERAARSDHRRRRLRREPGGRGHHRARAVRRPRVRSADAAPPAGHDRRAAARSGRAVVDVSFPEIEKFDHLPAPRADGRARLRVRSWKAAASTAASASCRTRAAMKSAAPSIRVLEEVRALAAAGRARSDAARPERQRLRSGRWRTARWWISRRSSITSRACRASSASASPPRIRSSSTTA